MRLQKKFGNEKVTILDDQGDNMATSEENNKQIDRKIFFSS